MFLIFQVLWELLVYDLVTRVIGFKGIVRWVSRQEVTSDLGLGVDAVCELVSLASCFYWKPVMCLQRSAVTARLLRKSGIPATMVVGYRSVPFFAHAWVESDHRVVNDFAGYKRRLAVLLTV
jgi:hypothetical protein